LLDKIPTIGEFLFRPLTKVDLKARTGSRIPIIDKMEEAFAERFILVIRLYATFLCKYEKYKIKKMQADQNLAHVESELN
jgi:hypothetical protein